MKKPISSSSTIFNRHCRQIDGYRFWGVGDILLCCFFVLVATVLFFANTSGQSISRDRIAVIEVNQKVISRITATEQQKTGVLAVESYGYKYEIEFKPGMVRIKTASCPDKICVASGWIKDASDIVVCLPGHLVLKWENGDAPVATGVDGVVG